MFSKLPAFALMVISLLGGGLRPVTGQPDPALHREKIRSDVERILNGKKTAAVVKMKNGTTRHGRIVRMDEDSFELAERISGQASVVNYDDVKKVKRQGTSTGAKTAIWIGVAAGAVILLVTLPKKGVIGPVCPLGCGL